ncbi:unnamed protein product [Linum trigynum]|uniref:Uncharacterized protein n=1 Tax=Linum trigynum TaxID=586398 RepID=A0AAV2FEB4_9ROSI
MELSPFRPPLRSLNDHRRPIPLVGHPTITRHSLCFSIVDKKGSTKKTTTLLTVRAKTMTLLPFCIGPPPLSGEDDEKEFEQEWKRRRDRIMRFQQGRGLQAMFLAR